MTFELQILKHIEINLNTSVIFFRKQVLFRLGVENLGCYVAPAAPTLHPREQ